MHNQFISAIKEHTLLPKLVVLIMDDDLICTFKYADYGVSEAFGHIIHSLAAEFNKIVESYKDKLPLKALRKEYPKFIWIAPPLNCSFDNNILRNKLTKSIKSTLEIQQHQMMLKIVICWEYDNSSLYRNGFFTADGFHKYWQSIDSAIEFWARNLAPAAQKGKSKQGKKLKSEVHCLGTDNSFQSNQGNIILHIYNSYRKDRFHWRKPLSNHKKLPTPPREYCY